MPTDSLPILSFEDIASWEEWLEEHHGSSNGIWLKFGKKNSGLQSITYAQALDVALCFGWIDSQLQKYDDKSYLQKFTPRRSKSIWSKNNIEHIKRLQKEGRMRPTGLKQVEEAKKDGRWENAYDSPSAITIPNDFLKELAKDKKAYDFFQTLNKTNIYAIAWRLQTAKKPETRAKRISVILTMLSKGKKFH